MWNVYVHKKVVADSRTPEYLGSPTMWFWAITFTAQKDVGSANTGNVTIQVIDFTTKDFADWKVLAPGQSITYALPNPVPDRLFNGEQFKIKVATNGDGVTCIFT